MATVLLRPLKSHYDIALACVTYLASCTADLLMHDEETSVALVNTAEGFHSLQLYANTFWTDHFIEFMNLYPGTQTIDPTPIMLQLQKLHANWKLNAALLPLAAQSGNSNELGLMNKKHARLLAPWEGIQVLLQDTLTHRRSLLQQQEKTLGQSFLCYPISSHHY